MSYSSTYHQEIGDPSRPAIRYRRNIPVKGPSGIVIFGVTTAICVAGFYQLGRGALEQQELNRERIWARIYLTPILQAEADRDLYRRQMASEAREAAIMKDVPGWKTGMKGIYNTKSYVQPSITIE